MDLSSVCFTYFLLEVLVMCEWGISEIQRFQIFYCLTEKLNIWLKARFKYSKSQLVLHSIEMKYIKKPVKDCIYFQLYQKFVLSEGFFWRWDGTGCLFVCGLFLNFFFSLWAPVWIYIIPSTHQEIPGEKSNSQKHINIMI